MQLMHFFQDIHLLYVHRDPPLLFHHLRPRQHVRRLRHQSLTSARPPPPKTFVDYLFYYQSFVIFRINDLEYILFENKMSENVNQNGKVVESQVEHSMTVRRELWLRYHASRRVKVLLFSHHGSPSANPFLVLAQPILSMDTHSAVQ